MPEVIKRMKEIVSMHQISSQDDFKIMSKKREENKKIEQNNFKNKIKKKATFCEKKIETSSEAEKKTKIF